MLPFAMLFPFPFSLSGRMLRDSAGRFVTPLVRLSFHRPYHNGRREQRRYPLYYRQD